MVFSCRDVFIFIWLISVLKALYCSPLDVNMTFGRISDRHRNRSPFGYGPSLGRRGCRKCWVENPVQTEGGIRATDHHVNGIWRQIQRPAENVSANISRGYMYASHGHVSLWVAS